MAQEPAPNPVPERYEEIVQKLGQVVERLEGGGLSLEEAIQAFEQGIRLARAGAQKLDAAEKRVEVLLENDRTQPFEATKAESAPTARAAAPRGRKPDEDVPF